jgi:hypothetical protein
MRPLPNFIWPRVSSKETTIMQRLGRFLHWTIVIVSAFICLRSLNSMTERTYHKFFNDNEEISEYEQLTKEFGGVGVNDYIPGMDYNSGMQDDAIFILIAIMLALFGRGIRYILSNE